jgi:hypothetical protein
VAPGETFGYTMTYNNVSDTLKSAQLKVQLAKGVSVVSADQGATCDVVPGWVNAGASVSTNIDLTVVGGNQTPPEGSIITLELRDLERGAAVSRTIGVNGG